ADHVEVDGRVEGQAAEHLRRRIAQAPGDERVRKFVHRKRDQQEDRDENDDLGSELKHRRLWSERDPPIVPAPSGGPGGTLALWLAVPGRWCRRSGALVLSRRGKPRAR